MTELGKVLDKEREIGRERQEELFGDLEEVVRAINSNLDEVKQEIEAIRNDTEQLENHEYFKESANETDIGT